MAFLINKSAMQVILQVIYENPIDAQIEFAQKFKIKWFK
jgi:hypothetical protein